MENKKIAQRTTLVPSQNQFYIREVLQLIHKKTDEIKYVFYTECERFELPVLMKVQRFSRPPQSTALVTLQNI